MAEAPEPAVRAATAERQAGPAGNVYDLGYRRYEGVRLGRRAAILALYRQSLRSAFGLGRGTSSKIAPALLIGAAMFPAVVVIAVASLIPGAEPAVFEHHAYYLSIMYVIALFAAVIAPEVVGRDQRSRTMPLYFSRAISRTDYALAKYAAVTTALLGVTLAPQALMFLGNGLVTDDVVGYARENGGEVLPIAGSALLGSALIAAVATAIAAQTPRRAFAIVGILVAFLLTIAVSAILVQEIDTAAVNWTALISPFTLLEGLTFWLFGEEGESELSALAGFPGHVYALGAVVMTLVGVGLVLRRYWRMQA